jgi:hypothetical protein
MRHVSDLKPLDESQWLGFEEKLVGNFLGIAGDPDPQDWAIYIYIYKTIISIYSC